MFIYLLNNLENTDHQWDVVLSYVVVAHSAKEARKLVGQTNSKTFSCYLIGSNSLYMNPRIVLKSDKAG